MKARKIEARIQGRARYFVKGFNPLNCFCVKNKQTFSAHKFTGGKLEIHSDCDLSKAILDVGYQEISLKELKEHGFKI
jgi:hypothetical protein